jgi:hypothetical protein
MVQHLKKAPEFSLDSDQEIEGLFEYVATLECKIWKLVTNASGTIVRMTDKVSATDAVAEVRARCSEPDTMDSLSEDTQKTVGDTGLVTQQSKMLIEAGQVDPDNGLNPPLGYSL